MDPTAPAAHEPVEASEAVWPPEPPAASEPRPASTPQQFTAPPVTHTASPHVSVGSRRSFPTGIVMMLVIAVVVIGPAVFAIGSLISSIGDIDVDGVSTPESHDGPSLIRRDRFAKALERIDDRIGPEATVYVLRVEAERVDAVVREGNGKGRAIQVRGDLSTSSFPAGAGGPRGISLRRIDPAAPQRIVRAGQRLLDSKDLSYMALSVSSLDGDGTWSAFFGGPGSSTLVIAKLDGRGAYVPGRGVPPAP